MFKDLNQRWVGEAQIVTSLLFFGISFVYQRSAMLNGMKPITYNACRYVVSTALLFITKYFSGDILHDDVLSTPQHEVVQQQGNRWKQLLFYGSILGIANFGGSLLQQIGLVTVTAGKTGFITGMYVVFVPIVEYLIPWYNSTFDVVACVAALVSLFGLYLLSGCAEQQVCFGGAIGEGEVIVFVSMLFWVISIIISDMGTKKVDVVMLTCVDFSVTTIITLVLAFIFEADNWQYPFTAIHDNWKTIILVGFTEAVAFLLSMLGQMYTPPTRAALLFSMEAAVCGIFSYFLLDETLSWIEIFGGSLMLCAAVFSSTHITTEIEELEGSMDEKLPLSVDKRSLNGSV